MRFDRLLVGAAIILVLYLFTNAIFNFFSPSQQQEVFRFFILGAPVAVILFLFPRFALVLLAFFVYFVDWLSAWVGIVPREFTWFIDLILIIFLVRYFLLYPRLRTRPVPMTIKWILGLLFFAVLSGLLNHVPAPTILVGLRVSMKYLLLFIVLYSMDFSEKYIKGLLYLQFAIALIQIPVTIIEFRLVPKTGLEPWDLVTGTFGHRLTGVLSIFLLSWIVFLIAVMLEQRRVRTKLLFLILLMTIPPILGEGKAFFLVLIPMVIFMLRHYWKKKPGQALAIGIFSLLIFVSVDWILVKTGLWIEGRNPISYILNYGNVLEEDLEGSKTSLTQGRFYQTKHAFQFATSTPQTFFFGYGPGAATKSFFRAYEAASVAYFGNWGIFAFSPTLPWMLVEYGVMGLLLFTVPLFLVYRRAIILLRSDREDYRILGSAFQGMTLLFLLGFFQVGIWQSDQLSFFFWTTAAIVTQLSYKEKGKKALEPSSIPAIQSAQASGTSPLTSVNH